MKLLALVLLVEATLLVAARVAYGARNRRSVK